MKFTKKEWKRIWEIARQRDIDTSQLKHLNCIRIHPTETDRHFNKKVEICRELYKNKHPFITEVWVEKSRKRYDILDLETNEDIEIETGMSKDKVYKGDKVFKV